MSGIRDGLRPLSPRNEVSPSVIRRAPSSLGWIDFPSLGAGVLLGAVGWGWGLPAFGAVFDATGAVPLMVSGTIAVAGFMVATHRPRPDVTKADAFRGLTPTRSMGLHPDTVAPLTPSEWLAQRKSSSPSRDRADALFVTDVENALHRQILMPADPYVNALMDILIGISAGRIEPGRLDALATMATAKDDREFKKGFASIASRQAWGRTKPGAYPQSITGFRGMLSDAIPDLDALRGEIGLRHAHPSTQFLACLAAARIKDVLPASDFAWLSRVDRPLWLAACSLGSTGTYAESLGIVSHYRAEIAKGEAIVGGRIEGGAEAILAIGTGKPDLVTDEAWC